jgi:hypothetical protein
MTIHEKLNLLWTKIINRLNDIRELIRAMDQNVSEFNDLYANENVKYCNKGHWAHIDCFGDSDICCSWKTHWQRPQMLRLLGGRHKVIFFFAR